MKMNESKSTAAINTSCFCSAQTSNKQIVYLCTSTVCNISPDFYFEQTSNKEIIYVKNTI